jgi:c-di-GMP-binding flagellar brake protein YcgR
MSFTRNLPIEATLGDFREARTIQRRAYFRANVSLPLVMAILASKTSKVGLQDRRASTVDIGGGGLRFDSELCPAVDDRVAIRVEVPLRLQKQIAPFLQIEAMVMRVEPVIRGDVDLHRLAVRFLVQRDLERDPWVRLTLDIQRSAQDDAQDPEAPPIIVDDDDDPAGS